jgi:hypothetical protein
MDPPALTHGATFATLLANPCCEKHGALLKHKERWAHTAAAYTPKAVAAHRRCIAEQWLKADVAEATATGTATASLHLAVTLTQQQER